MSKIENAKTDRVLPDDELDAVSGGSSEEPHESLLVQLYCYRSGQ